MINWVCAEHVYQAVSWRGIGCEPCHEARLEREREREWKRRQRRLLRENLRRGRAVILFCQ